MLGIALDCIRRGWYVFPCWPKTKKPLTHDGFKAATLDEELVRAWWAKTPDANVAIATGPSGLCVVDIDHGLGDGGEWAWTPQHALWEPTYTVRTGRRTELGIQMYFSGAGLKSTGWDRAPVSGDIRCATGYVMAAGSIHPDSGEAYSVMDAAEVMPVPDWVRQLTTKANDPSEASEITEATAEDWKRWLFGEVARTSLILNGYEKRVPNGWWFGVQCPWVTEHSSGAGVDSSTVIGVLDGKLAFECSHGTCKAAGRNTDVLRLWLISKGEPIDNEPGADIPVTLGTGAPKIVDEAGFFDGADTLLEWPEPTFFIENFLPHESICAIAAPVGQRKSLIVLNLIHALCTKEPLFGFLTVSDVPDRVLYLCPEMGRSSLAKRIKNIGLAGSLQSGYLRVRSMNQGSVDITDVLALPDSVLQNSVVILDTAIRFMAGDEQSAKDMKVFSSQLFELQRRQGNRGAIVILYHSPKATREAFELTLENCLRGSGELGAAVTDAHGTRMQPPEEGQHAWDARSFLSHVKNRDYEGEQDFEVSCDRATGRMIRAGDGTVKAVLSTKKPGTKANADGRDDEARAYIKANPEKTIPQLLEGLQNTLSIKRKKTWVTEVRLALRGSGSTVTG